MKSKSDMNKTQDLPTAVPPHLHLGPLTMSPHRLQKPIFSYTRSRERSTDIKRKRKGRIDQRKQVNTGEAERKEKKSGMRDARSSDKSSSRTPGNPT